MLKLLRSKRGEGYFDVVIVVLVVVMVLALILSAAPVVSAKIQLDQEFTVTCTYKTDIGLKALCSLPLFSRLLKILNVSIRPNSIITNKKPPRLSFKA